MAKTDSTVSTLKKGKKAVFATSANIHESLLNTSNLVIDETIATLTRAQKLTAKAIKKSEPIVEKQLDLMFDTADAVKGQAVKGGKRTLKLFGLTKQFNKITKNINEVVSDIPSTEDMVDTAKHYIVSAKKDVERTLDKATATVKRATDSMDNAQKSASKRVSTAKKTVKAKAKTVKSVKASTPIKGSIKKAKETSKRAASVAKKATAIAKKATPKANVKPSKKSAPKASAKKVSSVNKTVSKKSTSKKVAANFETAKINGIGPSLSQKMADNGIKTIADLQSASIEVLNKVKVQAGNRYASFDANKWIAAAKASK